MKKNGKIKILATITKKTNVVVNKEILVAEYALASDVGKNAVVS